MPSELNTASKTTCGVRRPVEGPAERDRLVSGKARLNTMKALVICDPAGWLLFRGETRPGSMRDLTQARTVGLVGLLLPAPLEIRVLAKAGEAGGTSHDRRRRREWKRHRRRR
ncbi:transposase family protein [Micromonospora echinospora]|uniref:transposase family protein n=1 Tax=Micromonospora echinospora TaxID=1877 RepID=UPI0034215F79